MPDPKWLEDASLFLDGKRNLDPDRRGRPVDCNADLARRLLAHIRELRAALIESDDELRDIVIGEFYGCEVYDRYMARMCDRRSILDRQEPPAI